jgi:acylpyruvate hydrolase
MRLLTFEYGPRRMLGAFVAEEKVIDLQETYALYLKDVLEDPRAEEMASERLPPDLARVLEGGEKSLAALKTAISFGTKIFNEGVVDLPYDLDSIELKAPLIPRTLLCVEANFEDYFEETHRTRPEHPGLFLKLPHSVIGPGEAIRVNPGFSKKVDYGVQLGVVMGKGGRGIPPERALEHVFGYTIVNNLSARDHEVIPWGGRGFQVRYGQGRNFDTSLALGPWVVTKGDLDEPENLSLRTWVNGELRQQNHTQNLLWRVPETISYLSRIMSLKPGFLIAMGTPGGCALGSDLALGANPYERGDGVKRGDYLQVDDVVRCEIQGIGVLENPVKRPSRRSPYTFSFKPLRRREEPSATRRRLGPGEEE